MPLFDDPHDAAALEAVKACFTDREVVGVPAREILLEAAISTASPNSSRPCRSASEASPQTRRRIPCVALSASTDASRITDDFTMGA